MLYLRKLVKGINERCSRIPLYGPSFASDVLRLVSGTAFAQAISILASPLITRIYGPEAFGTSAIFASLVGIGGVVACLRYELAIMLPEKDEDASNLLVLSLLLAALMSLFMIPVIWLGQGPLLQLLNAPVLAGYLWLAPFSVFLTGAFIALNYWNSRTRRFGRLSIARVNASIAITGTQIGAGLAGHATGGSLIGASILGSAVSTLILAVQIWRDDARILKESIKWSVLTTVLKRYKRFPLYDSWSALLSTISWQSPTFLLLYFFSTKEVGYYSLGMTVIQLPASLIGGAISQVFFQRAARAKFDGTLKELVENTVLRLGILWIFPTLLLALIGKEAFIVIFGNPWAEAGVYAQFLALWIFFVFITSPISTLFSILEMQKMSLIINIMILPIRCGAIIIGGMLDDPRLSIIFFSAVGVIIYAWANLWLMKQAGCSITKVLNRFVRYFIRCMPLAVIILSAKWILLLSPKYLVIVGGITMIAYYLILIKNNNIYQLE